MQFSPSGNAGILVFLDINVYTWSAFYCTLNTQYCIESYRIPSAVIMYRRAANSIDMQI